MHRDIVVRRPHLALVWIRIGQLREEKIGRNYGAKICKALNTGTRNLDFNQQAVQRYYYCYYYSAKMVNIF